MSLEDAVGSVVLLGGAVYVLDKVTGKRKRVKRRTIKSPKRAGTVSKAKIRKAVRRK